jgi:hypothetical protein
MNLHLVESCSQQFALQAAAVVADEVQYSIFFLRPASHASDSEAA